MRFFKTQINNKPVVFTFLFKNKVTGQWELNDQVSDTWPAKLRKISFRSLIQNQVDSFNRVIEPYFIESRRRYSIKEILQASLLHLEEVD